jgi:DegV family protein with EDD domain
LTIRIVTDSTCDLPAETIQRYGISVLPLYINVGNEGYLDGIDMSRAEFYRRLPTFSSHPTTAVPSAQKFHAIYEALAEEGASHILSIHIAHTLSGVVSVAQAAARETTSTLVTVLDSRQLSLGTGFLVEAAAQLAAAGSSITEILAALEQQIKRSHVFAALDTLEFLRRSGRMNRFMANMGALLQIKPIMIMNDGVPTSERVRTREHATRRVIEMLRNLGKLERVAIVHTHAPPERVADLIDRAAVLLPAGDILQVDITPVIGAHIGPGAAGFAVVTASG